MTVADLKALLADVPDWAAVEVVTGDEDYISTDDNLEITYERGVLTIDVV
uniref:Uncharacterized protein n=1 Tax=Streptomyces sp. NBC_01401 TaxID=2903854 RepID=A0AAU3H7T3_9ACTN